MRTLAVFMALGLLAYISQAKAFLKEFKVKFITAKFDIIRTQATGFKTIFFFVRIQISNMTEFKGTLNDAALNLFWGAKNLGHIDLRNAVTIEGNKMKVVEIPVQIATSAVIKSLPEILQMVANGKAIVFQAKGKLNFNAGSVTVNEPISVPLLTA